MLKFQPGFNKCGSVGVLVCLATLAAKADTNTNPAAATVESP